MDKKLVQLLQDQGLDGWESRIYLSLLPLGPSSVLEIAEAADLERTLCYRVIGRLQQKGLIRKVQDSDRTRYYAERPTVLHRLVEKDKERLADRESALLSSFPTLLDHYNRKKNILGIKYFQGITGFCEVMEYLTSALDLEAVAKFSLLCLDYEEKLLEYIRKYYPRYFKLREKKNIRANVLSPSGTIPLHLNTTRSQTELDERQKIPLSIHQSLFEFVLPDTLIQIFIGDYDVLAVVIEHEAFVKKEQAFFDLIWKDKNGQ